MSDALITALTELDLQRVEAVIRGNPDSVNGEIRFRNMTPLHCAAWLDFPQAVKLLLSHGADPHKKTQGEMTPLHYAVSANDPSSTLMLLEAGAGVDAESSSKLTPLHAAAANGRKDNVIILLERGADLRRAEELRKKTALHFAVEHNHPDVVDVLLERMAQSRVGDVNAVDVDDWTPLHLASRFNLTEIARKLVEAGAEADIMNKAGETALDVASFYTNTEMFVYLFLSILG
ncbi:Ankyrin-1 [Porphyridium purpureum]|uniref:Ankyrin-1 n=1 Tax=Porphyridium purpureum TaxID=35688 RepID=A0A5J4Z4M4_PORPP|nr:Ankyrin-1 [Porphyridium purpureum]|eukprot:POR3092..scf295_1